MAIGLIFQGSGVTQEQYLPYLAPCQIGHVLQEFFLIRI
jgi:hypothetical protein